MELCPLQHKYNPLEAHLDRFNHVSATFPIFHHHHQSPPELVSPSLERMARAGNR